MQNGIREYSLEGISDMMRSFGLPAFRAKQLVAWLYVKNASDYDSMTNLPKSMREQLKDALPLRNATVAKRQVSVDGSRKYLLRFHDGAQCECVALPSSDGRLTVCCSSQAGCAMACAFCATGAKGLTRSLFPGEIVEQIFIVQEDMNARVTNVVVMGQGEPFANYDNTMAALRIFNHQDLLNIGARHITVSTCGLIPQIERFSTEPEQFTLAVSLHAAVQDTRDTLMPRVSHMPLNHLRTAARTYTQRTGRRISFEYALMQGVNDSAEDLSQLIAFCKGMLCHVNLIPLNDVPGSPYKPVSALKMNEWRTSLEDEGVSATIRRSRGADIAGACGQLG